MKSTKVGVSSSAEVWLKTGASNWLRDIGRYKYYAGPVYFRQDGTGYQVAGGHNGSNWTGGLNVPEIPPAGYLRGTQHPWQLLDAFVAGVGGRYYITQEDTIGKQLRQDLWLVAAESAIIHRARSVAGGEAGSMRRNGMADGAAIRRDPRNIAAYLRGERTSDAALTLFGSYSLRYRVSKIPHKPLHRLMVIDVYNETSSAS
jgi:hypothetical protein